MESKEGSIEARCARLLGLGLTRAYMLEPTATRYRRFGSTGPSDEKEHDDQDDDSGDTDESHHSRI
jgi:hypothetical protein